MSLPPCGTCRYCVADPVPAVSYVTGDATIHNFTPARCRREPPVAMRGSDRAVWPIVDASGPGCGKHKVEEPT